MTNYRLDARLSNIQWAGYLLDGLVAPEFSTLDSIGLPEVPPLPDYFEAFLINNVLVARAADKARPLIFAMLRHLGQATIEYRAASHGLIEFSACKPQSNQAIAAYLRSLSQLEHVIIRVDLAVGLSHAIARSLDPNTPAQHYNPNENSPEERLRGLHNTLKHFDKRVLDGSVPDRVAPVWITRTGLRSLSEPSENNPAAPIELSFSELATMLTELADNARFLSEEAYRLAIELHRAKSGSAEPD